MRFYLVDRIESIQPGRQIVMSKALSLAEEYLADHFPAFPVLPGVLMLEALVQSAAWLVRVEQDFAKSVIELRRARNVRYASFVAPGQTLRCQAEAVSIGPDAAEFKAVGEVDGRQAVSARLELRCLNLAEADPRQAATDAQIVAQMKEAFRLIGGPEALAAAKC